MNLKKNNGITLVALIITIIIMLILAGVAISTITSGNGLFNKVEKAVGVQDIANEKEAIHINSMYAEIDFQFDKDRAHFLGKQLYDRNIANGNIWNIIYDQKSNKVYGTDWNYIEKGSEIENYGYTKNSWLLNTNTLELVMLEEGKHTELSYNSSLGVTDGLIFNLDSSIITDAESGNIAEQLGENVELINFDPNDNDSGITSTSFNLDGVNDYIKVQYDNAEEKEILAQNGFTFEFYGILNKGIGYDESSNIINNNTYSGIFCYWSGDERVQASMRFGIAYDKVIRWNTGGGTELSDFSQPNYNWNVQYPFDEELYNKELYFTITLDISNQYEKDGVIYYPQTLYINGQESSFKGGYNKLNWDRFLSVNINSLGYFCIGRSSMSSEGCWWYSKMNAYTMRLYNRALNQNEVLDNYNKSIAFRQTMVE